MLFTQEFISKLGTKSLSKDPEITKVRVNEAWDKASKEKQKEVLQLADVKYPIAYRVRTVGTITTKMTIAYSQALDMDPYYLIGAVSENAGYSYELAKKLLIKECKLQKAVIEFEKENPSKPESSQKKEETIEDAPKAKNAYSITTAIQNLTEEDLLGLFKALIIRAGVGKPEALEDMTTITEILMK